MTIKDLQEILNRYPDEAEVCFAPCDRNDNHWVEDGEIDFVSTNEKHKICSWDKASQLSVYLPVGDNYTISKDEE